VFDLLKVLVLNGGRLLQKDELLQEVWPDTFVEEGNLNRTSQFSERLWVRTLLETLYRDCSQTGLQIRRQCQEDNRQRLWDDRYQTGRAGFSN
jgi:hypothetical protein